MKHLNITVVWRNKEEQSWEGVMVKSIEIKENVVSGLRGYNLCLSSPVQSAILVKLIKRAKSSKVK